jgi:RND family efflux transporter MFP subunit
VKDGSQPPRKGIVTFVDNTVDPTSGTIKVKAEFDNRDAQLWPGMYVNVELAPRTLRDATIVPTQAVQTGPDNRFVYQVGEDNKVTAKPVNLTYVEESFAAVEGIPAGTRVVVEGAQNLRPGSAVQEAQREGAPGKGAPASGKGEGKKGKKAAS